MEQAQPTPARHNRLIGKLLLMVAGAFVFAFALVPLYDVLCAATGFNGKTAGQGVIRDGFGVGGLQTAAAPASKVDTGRTVRVEFTGTVMPGLPWDMRPLTISLDIHPGELQQVSYLVRNTSNQTVTGQAVPSVTPGQAAQHFEKIECFCFSQQTLGPGEAREMPLAFIVKPEVDRNISHITLSYAFFSIDGQRQTLTRPGEAR
ncbi:MAG: cytochrome c oxidase assembly protein subunit 11 [Rhodocyclaceae bacterium]|nr:MAG: cytochrome c oxidase assembly protein subunit 11 [Rhodocyclaceae bacterium]